MARTGKYAKAHLNTDFWARPSGTTAGTCSNTRRHYWRLGKFKQYTLCSGPGTHDGAAKKGQRFTKALPNKACQKCVKVLLSEGYVFEFKVEERKPLLRIEVKHG